MKGFTIPNLIVFDKFKEKDLKKWVLATIQNKKEWLHFIIKDWKCLTIKNNWTWLFIVWEIQTFLVYWENTWRKWDIFFCKIQHLSKIWNKILKEF